MTTPTWAKEFIVSTEQAANAMAELADIFNREVVPLFDLVPEMREIIKRDYVQAWLSRFMPEFAAAWIAYKLPERWLPKWERVIGAK